MFYIVLIFFKNLHVNASVTNFCKYIYNYTVDPYLTPKPTLKPTHATKPVPNRTRIPPQ